MKMPADSVDTVFPVTPGATESMAQCPVCDRMFPRKGLEQHVERCLLGIDDTPGMDDDVPAGIENWIETTTSELADILGRPQRPSSEDIAHLARVFTQKLDEVRSLRLMLDEAPTAGLGACLSPASMMAADEALAKKFMEDMQREEQTRQDERESEQRHFEALMHQEKTCRLCNEAFQEGLLVLPCDHKLCSSCLAKHILSVVQSPEYDCHTVCPVGGCCEDVPQWVIKQVLSSADFEIYLKKTVESAVEATDGLIQCPNKACGTIIERLDPGACQSQHLGGQVGLTGKTISAQAQAHCRACRFRCRQCDTVFCSECNAEPYHLGFTCEGYRVYLDSRKCRYCDDVLNNSSVPSDIDQRSRVQILDGMKQRKIQVEEGHPAHAAKSELVRHFRLVEDSVCMDDECRNNTLHGCMKQLACGHPCFGVVGEATCLPCLNEDCVRPDAQNQEEFCNICWTSALRSQPCIKLECGHIFHAQCVRDKIAAGRSSARIIFSFLECPLCKVHMQHPYLARDLAPHLQLFESVKEKALQRLKFEKLEADPMLKAGGRFHGDALGFALKKFAYYMCFKCSKPYFGGHRACEDLAEDEFNAQNKAEDLVCPSCAAGPGVTDCPVHGNEFIEYKCKFCCTVATWYCWGSTHFCDGCHKKQGTPEAWTRKKKSDYIKCGGGPTCPLKIAKHALAGEEFVLGCAVCRQSSD